jgi:hypothetical protein
MIYISGKITGTSDYMDRFAKAEKALRAKGWEVVNPAKENLPKNLPWEEYMKHDVKLLAGCDAIYMLDGWRQSRGACLERELALNLKLEVLYGDCNRIEQIEKIKEIGKNYKQDYINWGMSKSAKAFHKIMEIIGMEVEL